MHVGVRERPCLLIIRFCALVVCMYVEGPCRVKGGYGIHIFSSLCRKGGEAPQDYSDLLTATEEYRHRWAFAAQQEYRRASVSASPFSQTGALLKDKTDSADSSFETGAKTVRIRVVLFCLFALFLFRIRG